MLYFLQPSALLTKPGIYSAYLFIRELIARNHTHPFMKLVQYDERDLFFYFQVLHLVASEPYIALLEYIMAGYATHIVSDRRHLLAMDLTRDYRGDSITTREFNEDAYQVGCLFHRKRVDWELFRPFVKWRVRSRKEAYAALRYLKTCWDFGVLRAQRRAPSRGVPPKPSDSNSLLNVFKLVSDHVLRTKAKTVVTLVAVAQDYELLDAVLRRFREVRKDNDMEPLLLRAFVMGPHLGDGRGRLWVENGLKSTPVQVLRRLMN